MKIADFPPGLISRRAFPIDQGRVVVEEHWDISVPGCPLIRSPWHGPLNQPLANKYIRQITMTAEEYMRKRNLSADMGNQQTGRANECRQALV